MSNDKNNKIDIKTLTLPLIPIRGDLLLPHSTATFNIREEKEIAACQAAKLFDGYVIILPETLEGNELSSDYVLGRVVTVGTVVKCEQTENGLNMVVEGHDRAEVVAFVNGRKFPTATVVVRPIPFVDDAWTRELQTHLMVLFAECSKLLPRAEEFSARLKRCKGFDEIVDTVAGIFISRFEDKIDMLEEFDVQRRAELLAFKLQRDLFVVNNEMKVHQKVKQKIDENQRQYYMREQLKVLQEELGEDEGADEEIVEYMSNILTSAMPQPIKEKLLKETNKLSKMPYASAESTVIRGYIDTCLELPWTVKTEDRLDIVYAKEILDREHWGLEKVKERIIEFIAVEKLTDKQKSQILCLVGAPGVGKTSIASSVAHAMGRKFTRVALGGVKDESDIRGHRKTYIGSMPGRIINAIIEAKTTNPVILLDEIDKLTRDSHGDPASALLEVLDPDQNKNFRDHFLEIPFDLSDCLFIATANTLDTIPKPLLDRMEIIELNSYTRTEKLEIARAHLIPKVITKNGLKKRYTLFDDDAVLEIIDHYTREAGVRNLERELSTVCRKIACKFVEESKGSEKVRSHKIRVTLESVKEYLGPAKIIDDEKLVTDEIGVVNGLAYTEVGGELLRVESAVMSGTGKLELTGSLGEVMKESAKIALSIVRARADKYKLSDDFYKTKDIHIHFPEGAVPKDGPSAGVTLVTCLVSRLGDYPVRHDIAMTGEVTLSGRVLAIGGLREKTMAAYKNGIRKILIPYDNRKDIERMESYIKENVEFVLCKTVDDILDEAIITAKEYSTIEKKANIIDISHKRSVANEAEYRTDNA